MLDSVVPGALTRRDNGLTPSSICCWCGSIRSFAVAREAERPSEAKKPAVFLGTLVGKELWVGLQRDGGTGSS